MQIEERLAKGINRKINIKQYLPLLKEKFKEETLLALIKCLANNLPCNQCNKVLPLKDFTVSKMNRNRMCFHTLCRVCQQNNYQSLRGMM